MSNLEDRNASHIDEGTNTPKYPNLGATVAKHRRLNDTSYDGQKAYGQAVNAAIRALQRSALNRELPSHQSPCASGTWHSEGKDILKAIRAQHRSATQAAANGPTFDRTEDQLRHDYYRALFASRGIDVQTIIDLANAKQSDRITTWLQAAWNVIKIKRGTPYLVESGYVCGDGKRFATEGKAVEYANRVHLNTGIVIAVEKEPAPAPEAIEPAPQPKKRGRPFGSKLAEPTDAETYIARIRNPAKRDYARRYAEHIRNGGPAPTGYTCSYMAAQAVRSELYKLVKPEPEAEPKPSKPRVPSHYLSTASRVAYHAAM
jgi:hypothetical protein